jgi:hypothetical protein
VERQTTADDYLYKKGTEGKHFTLILQGTVEIVRDDETIESELGPFSHLGEEVLLEDKYL